MAKRVSGDVVQVVLARLVDDVEVVGVARVDLGERPKLRAIKRGEALMWLRRGTREDVAKAEAYAGREGYRVFCYGLGEKDALGCARRDVARAV